jgi:hypothetical protein
VPIDASRHQAGYAEGVFCGRPRKLNLKTPDLVIDLIVVSDLPATDKAPVLPYQSPNQDRPTLRLRERRHGGQSSCRTGVLAAPGRRAAHRPLPTRRITRQHRRSENERYRFVSVHFAPPSLVLTARNGDNATVSRMARNRDRAPQLPLFGVLARCFFEQCVIKETHPRGAPLACRLSPGRLACGWYTQVVFLPNAYRQSFRIVFFSDNQTALTRSPTYPSHDIGSSVNSSGAGGRLPGPLGPEGVCWSRRAYRVQAGARGPAAHTCLRPQAVKAMRRGRP